MLYECEPNCAYCKNNLSQARDRFFKFVDKSGSCWVWTGSRDPNGYGKFSYSSESVFAHRYSYALDKPLDKSLTLDHLCRNTSCVNPSHLEQVTIGVNTSRAPKHIVHGDFSGVVRSRDACRKGHRLTKDNVYISNGARRCKICRIAWGVGRKTVHKRLQNI